MSSTHPFCAGEPWADQEVEQRAKLRVLRKYGGSSARSEPPGVIAAKKRKIAKRRARAKAARQARRTGR